MEFNDAVKIRRSIRTYEDREISDETLKELFETAALAPSWKNAQTTRYHVVKTPETLAEFKKNCLPEFNAKNVENAPVLVVVTFVKDRAGYDRNGSPTNEFGNGWGTYDAGLASENLMLAAVEAGLGTLVMGIRDEKQIRKMLEIPANEIIISVISIGYGSTKMVQPARKEFDDFVKMY